MGEEGYLNDLLYEDRPMRLAVPNLFQRVDDMIGSLFSQRRNGDM